MTFPQGNRIRIVEIRELGTRRGPATEAATLYQDLTPPPEARSDDQAASPRRGRPTKADRRAITRLKESRETDL